MEAAEEGTFACFSFPCSNLQLYQGFVIASRKPARVGLCSFAKILLDFALTHTSFVPPRSGINVFKKFPSVYYHPAMQNLSQTFVS